MTAWRTLLPERPIAAATAGPIAEEHVPVLLWVHTGTATVEAASTSYQISAGEAAWIPPGIVHCTRTDEGGVVLPIFPRLADLRGALTEVRVVSIPAGWEAWLVSQFDFNRHHTRDAPSGLDALMQLVVGSPSDHGGSRRAGTVPALPMPHSREGRAAAQTLLRYPGSRWQVSELAARESVSARTLQRQFLDETGMVLSEWRTRARVVVAARYLTDGRQVGWTGRRVGFATPAGFTRAFQRHLGVGPREYARRSHALGGDPATSVDEAAVQLAALVTDDPPEAPVIPPRQVWGWVYDWHVLWWVYHGQVDVRVGTRGFSLRRGDALWIPAGFSASVEERAEGSILLPLGNRHGGAPIGVDELETFSLSAFADAVLLHTVLTEYTLFRPDVDRPRLADELFRQQFAPSRRRGTGGGPTGAVAAIARGLRRDPADQRSLADWATHLRLSPQQVGTEFRTQTGSSFPRWRAQLRMSFARELLMFGDPPRQVAKRLGYATPAAFSKVFTTAHGISPLRYQQRVCTRLALEA